MPYLPPMGGENATHGEHTLVFDHDTLELKKIDRVASIAKQLLFAPEKIDVCELAVECKAVQKVCGQKNAAVMDGFFEDSVEKFTDVPTDWLWGWCRNVSQKPISDEAIKKVMRRGPSKFKHCMTYLTRIPPGWKLISKNMEDMAAIMNACHTAIGKPLDLGEGFFRECATIEQQIFLKDGIHGEYSLVADETDREKVTTIYM